MDGLLKDMLRNMMTKKYYGARHTPEKLAVHSTIKFANKEERKKFYEEYQLIINKGYILRSKKRTGKGFDWHISLNPHTTGELIEEME